MCCRLPPAPHPADASLPSAAHFATLIGAPLRATFMIGR
jgi:hypothetical protein